jgi:hypothetical protein
MIHVVAAEFAARERAAPVGEWLRGHFPRWAEPAPNLWIVDGPLAAEQIMNALQPLCRRGDRLVIVKAGTEAIWQGLAPEDARWMAESFPGSVTERIPSAQEGTAGR